MYKWILFIYFDYPDKDFEFSYQFETAIDKHSSLILSGKFINLKILISESVANAFSGFRFAGKRHAGVKMTLI